MKNFIEKGDSLDVVLGGTALPGAVAEIQDLLGVYTAGGASGELAAVQVKGVYALPKATGGGSGIAQGKKVYWTGSAVTATAAGNKPLGYVWKTAADADTTVRVDIVLGLAGGSDSGLADIAALTVLTDNTGGTADNTLALITSTTPADLAAVGAQLVIIKNNFADVAAKINAIINAAS